MWRLLGFCIFFCSCQSVKRMNWPGRYSSLTGTEFYKQAAAMKWAARDSLAISELLAGNVPDI